MTTTTAVRRTVWISVAVTLAVIASVIGVAVWQAGGSEDPAVPPGTTADGHGLVVGSGPVTVEVYYDFMCPVCRRFEEAAGPVLDGYLAQRKITLVHRPIAILDRLSQGTEFSTRAAAAAGCAAEGGKTGAFLDAMMANQPAEGSPGLPDEEIVRVGTGAGLSAGTFGECVREHRYADWVAGNTTASTERGVAGTPTVYVGGAQLDLSVEALIAAIEAAA